MSQPSVYLETSFISYLTSRLSGDLITAAHQKLTRTWWDTQRTQFALYVSGFVLREVSMGDPTAVADRQRVLAEGRVKNLVVSPEVGPLADLLIGKHLLPPKARIDAFHIAMAAFHGVDYLLTWNCTHIANAVIRDQIATSIRDRGYKPPILCTPEELMIGMNHDTE